MSPKDFLKKLTEYDLENTIQADAVRKLNALGMPKISVPDIEEPKYPADISLLGSQALGQLYGVFMGWVAYCKYLYQLKEADVLLAKSLVSQARRYVATELGITGSNKKEKDLIDNDDIVMKMEFILTEYEIQKTTVGSRLEFFDSCAKALSREISRRQLDAEKTSL